ncbi:MAG: Hsp20/alpha crystallin family protein [Bacteroidetes bacterium]|mgnify:FL=1|nr:Hsp20/alpha crystallin family protein [Bacteroidota bacterium]
MTLLTVKPENGRFATPRFSNLFDSFFENEFQNVNRKEFFKTPALVNVKDTEAAYIIDVAAPGFNKEEISIKVENNLLTIKAEQKNETETKEEKYTRKEFNFSSFNRSFTLPKTVDADKIGAAYQNGILSVTLPKKEEAKPTAAIDIKIS